MESIKLGIVGAVHYHSADDWGQLGGRARAQGQLPLPIPPLEPPMKCGGFDVYCL